VTEERSCWQQRLTVKRRGRSFRVDATSAGAERSTAHTKETGDDGGAQKMTKELGVWTAEDCALVLIDYQKEMFEVIRSETRADLVELHVRLLAKTAKAFNMPIVLSTVGVGYGLTDLPCRRSCPSLTASSRSIGRQ
jgi:hypothetical protein